ncbi:metal ABC transporter substrate-binding protein [Cupriavidus sp. USMAA2-4]|uniref:Lipoprotein n=1 Tax=Cupriavidus malaysiensis TaxID=367825 RepID=A0A1D9IBT2_9BURK|nr:MULTISPECIES: MetQ/NlpA family lipoprotein [Cupriavidus]AOY96411.1 metal ABC transporter substrate-binding protein [Cupriavidus sp. USMAA2-4]AOZ03190.1 metal ABC transporter substrate-binding protein [Cupriavidus sp. USMAHM13]AOZ09445.1 metal ABC transporter substrate-binding protein [Cupriavidus malaysiensis]
MLKSLGKLAALAALVLAVGAVAAQERTRIKVGVSVGNAEQTFEVVKKVAARDGLDIQVVVFSDYLQPNEALAAGDLDANAFQHKPFLDSQIKARGYKIVPVGLTLTAPLGIYSKRYKSVDQLPAGARIGIQNDPSNGNRALLLLQKAGLLKLRPGVGENGVNATPLDVVENPRKLKLIELDAAQLPRALDDLAAASINNDYAFRAGLSLQRDTIAVEDAKGPYANLIATRAEDKDKPWVRKLVKAYQSEEVRRFIESEFKGSLVPAF